MSLGREKKPETERIRIRTCLIFVLKHVANKSGQSD